MALQQYSFPNLNRYELSPYMNDPFSQSLVPGMMNEVGTGLRSILTADIVDKGTSYEVFADLPGIKKDDLDLSIVNGSLMIRGERRRNFQDSDVWGNFISERSYGKVERTLRLPTDADISKTVTTFENGVLSVAMPKLGGSSNISKKLTIT